MMAEAGNGRSTPDHPVSPLGHRAFSACRSLFSSTSLSWRLCTTQEPFFCSHPVPFPSLVFTFFRYLQAVITSPVALLQPEQAAASP